MRNDINRVGIGLMTVGVVLLLGNGVYKFSSGGIGSDLGEAIVNGKDDRAALPQSSPSGPKNDGAGREKTAMNEKSAPKVEQKAEGTAPQITQTGQNNIAQIGNNNRAVINAKPVRRSLTEPQRQAILAALKRYPGGIVRIESLEFDDESKDYALEFVYLFDEAAWDMGGKQAWKTIAGTRTPVGIKLWVNTEQDGRDGSAIIVATALRAAGIDFGNEVVVGFEDVPDKGVKLFIGRQPD